MKKLFYILSVAALVLSCGKMESGNTAPDNTAPDNTPAADGTTTLSVSAGIETKTYWNNNQVKWVRDDILNVFAADGSSAFSDAFTGTASATYDFTVAGWPADKTPVLALAAGPESYYKLDAAANVGYTDGILTAFLRNDQVLYQKGTFGKLSNLAVGEMKYDDETGVWSALMKNLCGLIRFQIEGDNVKKVVISDAGGKALVGEVQIEMVDGTPTVKAVNKGLSAITISAISSSSLNNQTGMLPHLTESNNNYIYACVLPGEYNLVIEAYAADGALLNKLTAKEPTTITRNMYETIPLAVDTCKPSEGGGDEPVKPAATKTLTIDFSESWPFTPDKPSGKGTGDANITKTKTEYSFTSDGVTYPITVFAPQTGFYNTGSALRFNGTGGGYITSPAIEGFALSSVETTITNTSYSGKTMSIYTSGSEQTGDDGSVTDVWFADNDKIADLMTPSDSQTVSVNLNGTSANTMYYLFTDDNHYQLGKLVLTYTEVTQ